MGCLRKTLDFIKKLCKSPLRLKVEVLPTVPSRVSLSIVFECWTRWFPSIKFSFCSISTFATGIARYLRVRSCRAGIHYSLTALNVFRRLQFLDKKAQKECYAMKQTVLNFLKCFALLAGIAIVNCINT